MMAFEYPGDGSLDYFPCRYGTSRLVFRGPRRDLSRPYVAVLGGAETYGKFVQNPFPTLLERETGLRVVNLGLANAGLDAFLKDSEVMEIVGNARATIVQITGAQNLSNRYYSVHPRRNDRFVAASHHLRSIYKEVDFTDFHFTRHLLWHLQSVSADRFEVIAEELRAAWVKQMRCLLRAARGKTCLLWLGHEPPPDPGRRADLKREPLIIDKEMISSVKNLTAEYVEFIPSAAACEAGTEGMVLGPMDAPVAGGLPGPMVHKELSAVLKTALLRCLK